METWEPTLSTGTLLGIAVAAVAVILVLVIYFKLHAFLTLLVVRLPSFSGHPISADFVSVGEDVHCE
ncbi:hypothetical protein ABRP87_10980, partial [Corynebacterium sp. KPL2830]